MRNALLAAALTFGFALAITPATAAPVGSFAGAKAAAKSDVVHVGYRRYQRGVRYYGQPYGPYYRPRPYLVARNYGWVTRSYGYYPSPAVYYNAPVYYYGAPGVLYTPVVRYYAVPPPVVVYERGYPGYYDGYRGYPRGAYARW